MSEEQDDNLEEAVRAVARELIRTFERMFEDDVDTIANLFGVDPERARERADAAAQWVRDRAGDLKPDEQPRSARAKSTGPDPLDRPTPDQGRALAALDSGRWTVAPGTDEIAATGDESPPEDAHALVAELRARDWLGADGQVTEVGRHALRRWLDAADR